MKKGIIVQARMTSQRLPGKILRTVLGKPLLEYEIERLKRVKLADEIIIATTDNAEDNPVVTLCERMGIQHFRGSEDDVLSRFYGAALSAKANVVVRVTGDCPIIDPQVISNVMQYYLNHQNRYDYVSNTLIRTFPRGMDVEVFSFDSLQKAYNQASLQPEREHVTPYIYRNELFCTANIKYHENQSNHRWTVDTIEDFELIQKIIELLYPQNPNFTMEDCLKLFSLCPELMAINCHIEQKKLGQ